MTKNIVITGATSGIGLALLKQLTSKNENIIAIGMNQNECDKTYLEIGSPSNVTFIPVDLSSKKQVSNGTTTIKKLLNKHGLHALIHIAAVVPQKYKESEDGIEMMFHVNHLAPMQLTLNLLEDLKRAHGIIITTSSRIHRLHGLDFDDLMNKKKYFILNVYGRSKLCNVLFTYEFNRRYINDNLISYTVDPGLVNTKIGERNTKGFFNIFWKLRRRLGKTTEDTIPFYTALLNKPHDNEESYYYKEGIRIEPSKFGKDEENGRKLWDQSNKLLS